MLATLDELSGGRMDLGIGRGDSARRVLGKPPITLANTEEAILVIKALVEGRCAGAGLELALACDHRWAVATLLGQDEAELWPGGGRTRRPVGVRL